MSEKTKKKRKHLLYFTLPHGSDIWLHAAMLALMLFGLVMVGSASMGLAVSNPRYLIISIIKQAVFVIGGYFGMTFLANRFTLDFLRGSKISSLIILTVLALFACLAFPEVDGARAWLRASLGGTQITLQPSEFAKIVSILIVAAYTGDISKRFEKNYNLWIKPVAFILFFVFIVLVIQSDFGSAMVIFLISCVCVLVPNNPQLRGFQTLLKVLFWVVLSALIFVLSPYGEPLIENMSFLKDYQKKRFLTAVDPFSDKYGYGYHVVNGLIGFATGGWFGLGFGNSIRKYTDFPAANTDFILAILVEELGFVGFMVLLFIYGIVIFRLFRNALKIKSEKARVILVGTASYLLIHMVFNVGGVTGLLPLTGIPLLMISAGGSSTLSFMMAVGLSQAVISGYRRGEIE